eukprot:gene10301-biopygen7752
MASGSSLAFRRLSRATLKFILSVRLAETREHREASRASVTDSRSARCDVGGDPRGGCALGVVRKAPAFATRPRQCPVTLVGRAGAAVVARCAAWKRRTIVGEVSKCWFTDNFRGPGLAPMRPGQTNGIRFPTYCRNPTKRDVQYFARSGSAASIDHWTTHLTPPSPPFLRAPRVAGIRGGRKSRWGYLLEGSRPIADTR